MAPSFMQQSRGSKRPCSSPQLALLLLLGCLAVGVPQALGQACSNYTVCAAAPRIMLGQAVTGNRYTFDEYIPTQEPGLCFGAASALDVSQVLDSALGGAYIGASGSIMIGAVAFQSTTFPATHSSSAWIVATCDGCSTSSSGLIKMVQLVFTWSGTRNSNVGTCVFATAAKYLPNAGRVLTSAVVNAAWSNANARAMNPVSSIDGAGYGVPYLELQTGGVSSECGMLSRAMGLTWSNTTVMTTSCGLTAPGISRPIDTSISVFFYCMKATSATVYSRQLKQAWSVAQPTPLPGFVSTMNATYKGAPSGAYAGLWMLFTCQLDAASMPLKTSGLAGQWTSVYEYQAPKISPPPPSPPPPKRPPFPPPPSPESPSTDPPPPPPPPPPPVPQQFYWRLHYSTPPSPPAPSPRPPSQRPPSPPRMG